MAKIIILGSAGGVPDVNHEGTHLAVLDGQKTILVDCAGNPMARMKQACIELDSIEDLVLTHYHPDHVYGVPMLLMGMWLLKRKKSLAVYGSLRTLSRLRKTMELYDWKNWKGFYEINFHNVPAKPLTPILETPTMRVLASPVVHLIPTIGLRFEFLSEGWCAAYTSDTQPCPAVQGLARGVEVLIHEAMGDGKGHTSPRQAGETAAQAGAKRLYLIHYPTSVAAEEWVGQTRTAFSGSITMATDFMTIEN
ncbi:MAG: MBL fold metallo-hydrolase [Anaerolineaceae bacterium]